MEAREFEERLEERFAHYGNQTPETVWEGIAAHLDGKKRRIGFWWWTALGAFLLLFAGTATFLSISGKSESISSKNSMHSNIEKTRASNNSIQGQEKNAANITSNEKQSGWKQNSANKSTQHQFTPSDKEWNSAASLNPASKTIKNSNAINEIIQNSSGLNEEKGISARNEADTSLEITLPKNLTTLPLENDQELRRQNVVLSFPPKARASHRIGIQLGTFINLSPLRSLDDPQPNTWSLSADNTTRTISYFRYLEVMPYYQLSFTNRPFHLRFNALLSGSQSSVSDTNYLRTNRQKSVGSGFGIYYQPFAKGRVNIQFYGATQWELNFGKFEEISNGNGSTIGLPVPNGVLESSGGIYRQHTVSLEVGSEIHYYLHPRWELHGSLGYRNYFWHQPMNGTFLVKTPHLLKFGIGISWRM